MATMTLRANSHRDLADDRTTASGAPNTFPSIRRHANLMGGSAQQTFMPHAAHNA